MVPPYSYRVSRVRQYSGFSLLTSFFAYVIITLFDLSSHTVQLNSVILFAVLTPRIFLLLVWPLPLSLATTHRISFDFFSSPYLDVSVQAVPLIYLFYSAYDNQTLLWLDYSIRTSMAHCLLTTPHGFSQFAASFFGSQYQGIPLVPFVAWPYMLLFGSFYLKL